MNRPQVRHLRPFEYDSPEHVGKTWIDHGTSVASKAWGATLGMGRRAELVVVDNFFGPTPDMNNFIQERRLDSLVRVLNDVAAGYPANSGKVIVNMSFGWLNTKASTRFVHREFFNMFCKVAPRGLLPFSRAALTLANRQTRFSRSLTSTTQSWYPPSTTNTETQR